VASNELPRPRSVTLRLPSRVQRIDFVDEPTRCSVIIDLDEVPMFSLERAGGNRVSLRLLHAQLPRGLERSLDATEYLGPVRIISTYRDPDASGAVRVDVDMAEDVPNKIRQDGSRLYWDFQKRALNQRMGLQTKPARAHARSLDPRITWVPAPKFAGFRAVLAGVYAQQPLVPSVGAGGNTFRPGGTSKKRYTGRRVDLDLKNADIHNILRLLSDVGQVNIVLSDDVKGEVTVKMKDVPWDQALDVVLRGKQLGSVREGNLIRVAPLTVLEKELEQEIARQKQITDVLPTETRLIGVSYAEARVLQDRAKDLLSQRGKISVDERTNNLIVSDVSKNLALIEELVRNLDTQTSQVVIEARIVEARSTFVRQIGVQWGGTGFADVQHGNPTGLAFPYNIGVGGGADDAQAPTTGLVPSPRSGLAAANPNFAVNLPVAAGTGAGGALGLTLGSVAGAFNLNLRLSALESTGQVRIISSPRVTTLDNMEASIEQGVAIPISVVSAQGVQTVFVNANLNLTVKPHVTNEGTVMLNINVTRNEPDFVNTGARGDPTILKKEAKTAMLVRDGDTAVIGGIYTRNSGLNYAKVPFFADIPILGAMFRNRRENDDRTEFLVFITPRIANRARALGQ
jgi:type IV pilus assembly protein PilQ